MKVKIIYSKRKTFGITVKEGEVIVRSPIGRSEKEIEELLKKHSRWLSGALSRDKIRQERFSSLTESDIAVLKERAREYLTERCEYYSKLMGLKYKRISINSAKGRFGSCSSIGNINFSYRLMLYPEPAREYVVVHELAHLVKMDHSAEFYKIIERYLPDYKERRAMLKSNKNC